MNRDINDEILEHLMHPKNYGTIQDPHGVGVAHSPKSGEFVITYIKLDNSNISEITYATNGCQDTVILGSMFSEMIKGESIEYAQNSSNKMLDKITDATQRACAEMVIKSFRASLQLQQSEPFVIEIDEECVINE